MRRSAVVVVTLLLGAAPLRAAPVSTGPAAPELAALDRAMAQLLEQWNLPGGALAIARGPRLVYARGFGYADVAQRTPIEPDSLFRVASVSKTITAIVVWRLIEAGRLSLDQPILPLLKERAPPANKIRDPRVRDIKIRHLLGHTGGWDRSDGRDQLNHPRIAQLAARAGVGRPRCADIVRPALEEPLDFTPGERHAYSNLGYCILGVIAENIAGKSYTDLARELVFEPAGARGIRPGRTLLADRAPREVMYYDYAPAAESWPGVAAGKVARPYGRVMIEGRESLGGWIASPIDYVQVLLALEGTRGARLLSVASLATLAARPPHEPDKPAYYGLGFHVIAGRESFHLAHGGNLPGNMAYVMRLANGTVWAAFFNSQPREVAAAFRDVTRLINTALREVTAWPEHDLFAQFGR